MWGIRAKPSVLPSTQHMPQTEIQQPTTELPRVLNVSHATSIVVGIIIGSGIFLVPREMMAAVGSSLAVYGVWIVGGLLSLLGAMPYATYVASLPRFGSIEALISYVYSDMEGHVFVLT